MALPRPQQQQPQIFPFDLDTQRTDPYKRNFVFTPPRWKGWNVVFAVVVAGSWSPLLCHQRRRSEHRWPALYNDEL